MIETGKTLSLYERFQALSKETDDEGKPEAVAPQEAATKVGDDIPEYLKTEAGIWDRLVERRKRGEEMVVFDNQE